MEEEKKVGEEQKLSKIELIPISTDFPTDRINIPSSMEIHLELSESKSLIIPNHSKGELDRIVNSEKFQNEELKNKKHFDKYDKESNQNIYIATDFSSRILNSNSKVLVIYSGGTIGMIRNQNNSFEPSRSFLANFLKNSPEFQSPKIPQVTVTAFDPPLGKKKIF